MPPCVVSIFGDGRTRVLSELVGMLTHRRVEVVSINAALAREHWQVQLVVSALDEPAIELLVKRINRIVGVVNVVCLDEESAHQRTATMVSVNAADSAIRSQVLELALALHAEVVEVDGRTVKLSFVGTPARRREFLDVMEPFGIAEIARSGPIALRRARRDAPRSAAAVPMSVVPA
ncbi:MAG TPA: acetolactate synthase small subunit [Streptosporangiaceae bacterium]|jgi:acetolactate synthase-1/3 small subunit|nr:acetolactate synthase small subunit [Streptosporangiaceae bacterium]